MQENRKLIAVVIAGLVLLAAGLAVAKRRLPEWRAGAIGDRAAFASRLQASAQRAHIELTSPPRVDLRSTSISEDNSDIERGDPAYREFGLHAADWLTEKGRGPFVEASADARLPGGVSDPGRLTVVYCLIGEPVSVQWTPRHPFAAGGSQARARTAAQKDLIAAIALPGASIAGAEEVDVFGTLVTIIPVPRTNPPESLQIVGVPGSEMSFAVRVPGTAAAQRKRLQSIDLAEIVGPKIPELLIKSILSLGTLTLFMVLLIRRRIDLRHALILAIAAALFVIAEPLRQSDSWYQLFRLGSAVIAQAIAIFVLWSAAESWIRSSTPGFRTSLDELLAGRIGPRSGRSLLVGWGGGAAVGGLSLMAMTAATMIPGVSPTDASIRLPIFHPETSPLGQGILYAGFVLLAVGAAIRLPFIRRIPFAGVITAALFLATRVQISGFWFALAASLVIGGALVLIYSRFGLTALLTTTIVSLSLPTAIYAALHTAWLSGTLAATSVLSLAPVVLGVIGLLRPAESEEREVRLPAFVRRLETERRRQHEMDLLARMQLGLLPRDTPQVSGYEIAARSLLATEAGGDLYDFLTDERDRLWIAAGDVSGHGYSCAIAQAMTKAGLASLVGAEQTPAAVLSRLDRVLRSSGSARTFTSLALLRLDVERGEGLIANAGHPYPLLAMRDDVVEIPIPSLPLGQGPPRSYEDHAVRINTGDVMVFFSDGLFEATNGNGSAYGFERLRDILASSRRLPARAILDRIVEDWTRHLGQSDAADDTTIVIVKRTGVVVGR